MLSKLTIKNVALIDSAEIEFCAGLNVLSGETGAGKSVILDSVNFVLGAKADKTMIRYGETECMVKAEFSVPEESKAVRALREMDIDTDGDIIISRRFSESGKSSIKLNGNTVTVSMLRKVTDSLVDVHGQSEHFFLLKEVNQLRTLDGVIGEELIPRKERLAGLLSEMQKIEQQINLLGGDVKERGRRLDILKFQIDEIEAVGLKDGEEEELLAKRNKINNLEKIISAVHEATEALSGENGALDYIRSSKRAMSGISRLDEEYSAVCDRLESLSLEADDIAETLSEMGEDLYFDEDEARETENRLDEIASLKRKYGADKKEIDSYLKKSKEEYDLLSDCEGQYAILTEKSECVRKQIYEVCREITALRKKHGEAFCRRVTEELKTLNIRNAKFEIQFGDYALQDAASAGINGLDELCFLFSANAGEPLKPLGKIISGGEMSRFMLAIKTQLSNVNEISTYIFDEIDAGISGKTAKVVGEKFAKIAKNMQIIAVSHLAQIAAMSDREFLIEKREEDGKTHTYVRMLDEGEKTQEIVRLLGGESGEEFAVKHAEELVRQAKEYKAAIN
ncbi:MAG: DNA repair protein RecN [Christensenellaceae bacterium]